MLQDCIVMWIYFCWSIIFIMKKFSCSTRKYRDESVYMVNKDAPRTRKMVFMYSSIVLLKGPFLSVRYGSLSAVQFDIKLDEYLLLPATRSVPSKFLFYFEANNYKRILIIFAFWHARTTFFAHCKHSIFCNWY